STLDFRVRGTRTTRSARSPPRPGMLHSGHTSGRTGRRPYRLCAPSGLHQFPQLEQVAEAGFDRGPPGRPGGGDVEPAVHHRLQVVAGHTQPDLRGRVFAVGDVDQLTAAQPTVEGVVQVGDVDGDRPVEGELGRGGWIAAEPGRDLVQRLPALLDRGHAFL